MHLAAEMGGLAVLCRRADPVHRQTCRQKYCKSSLYFHEGLQSRFSKFFVYGGNDTTAVAIQVMVRDILDLEVSRSWAGGGGAYWFVACP